MDPGFGAPAYSEYYQLAYDPLIVRRPDGSYGPGLATSWSYGPKNETFTMTLRPGVRFSDGTSLDAAAVKTWIEHTLPLPGGSAPEFLGALSSISVLSPLKVQLTFKAPTPSLPLAFSQIVGIGGVASPKAVAAKSLTSATDGAGEYELDQSQTVANSQYTFIPNPYYWNKAAVHWSKVVIKVVTDPNAALDAVMSGQAQIAETMPATDAAAAKKAGLNVAAPLTLYMALDFLDLDGAQVKALANPLVRQALNYAVDRKAVAAVLGAGYAQPISQMAVPGDDSYDPSLVDAYPYDPAKAKALLAQAGYPNGFTLPVLSLNVAQQDTLGEILQGQLAKVGVTLQLNIKTSVSDYESALGGTKPPATTLSWGRLPAAIEYQLLWGPPPRSAYRTQSPPLNALYQQLLIAPASQADSIAQKMQEYLVSNAWFLPVAATPLVSIYRQTLTGVNSTGARGLPYDVEYQPAR